MTTTINYGTIDNIAAATSVEWHRGCAIAAHGLTVDQQLAACDLDWEVKTSGFRYGENYQHREQEMSIAYRGDTGMFIDTYKDRRPWQNREILSHFHQFCEQSDLNVSHVGSLQDGKTIFAAADLPVQVDVGNCGDITQYWLLLRDSHLNGKGLQISLYGNRLVCLNGQHELIRVKGQTLSHLGEFNPDRVSEVLEAAIAAVHQKEQVHNKLAATQITIEEATLQLLTAFGEPGKAIEDQPKLIQTALKLFQGQAKGSDYLSAYNTAYGLLQAVTEHFNWSPSRNAQTQFSSVLGGTRGQKMAAFERQLVSVYC